MDFAATSDFTAMPRWSMLNSMITFQRLPFNDRAAFTARAKRGRGGRPSPPNLCSVSAAHNLLHQRIRVALVLGDLGRVTLEAITIHFCARFFEHRIAQHLD